MKKIFCVLTMLIVSCINVNAEGYWTDGYWDNANQMWVEGYWTENDSLTNNSYYNHLQIGDYSADLVWDGYQDVVDAENSAAIWSYGYGTKTVIGDHAHQGFNVISNLEPGATAQYWSGGVESTLTMASKYSGVNNGYQLMIDGKDIEEFQDGWLVMYTCTDWLGSNVTITFWN